MNKAQVSRPEIDVEYYRLRARRLRGEAMSRLFAAAAIKATAALRHAGSVLWQTRQRQRSR